MARGQTLTPTPGVLSWSFWIFFARYQEFIPLRRRFNLVHPWTCSLSIGLRLLMCCRIVWASQLRFQRLSHLLGDPSVGAPAVAPHARAVNENKELLLQRAKAFERTGRRWEAWDYLLFHCWRTYAFHLPLQLVERIFKFKALPSGRWLRMWKNIPQCHSQQAGG